MYLSVIFCLFEFLLCRWVFSLFSATFWSLIYGVLILQPMIPEVQKDYLNQKLRQQMQESKEDSEWLRREEEKLVWFKCTVLT